MRQVDSYRDGGSIRINIDESQYYVIDMRMSTHTKGVLYRGYPDKAGSYIVQSISELSQVRTFIECNIDIDAQYPNIKNGLKTLLDCIQ